MTESGDETGEDIHNRRLYTTQGASAVALATWMGRYAALTRLIRKLGESIDDVTRDALLSAQKHAKQLAGL